MASQTPAIVIPRTRLLQSLVDCPAPVVPQCTACFPTVGTRTSRALLKRSSVGAPTMKVRVACSAPGTPPLTGASTNTRSAPSLPSSSLCMLTLHFGPVDEQSMKNLGWSSLGSTLSSPRSPRKTPSTCPALGSMLITVSTPGDLARSAGLVTTSAPMALKSWRAFSFVSHTTTCSKRPLLSKFSHMGLPIAPTPTKPIRREEPESPSDGRE
mmetsp:Transcript_132/g.518  ORF Transcript_132/g.518 Transcript_132/m.518 type:complete len:212 (+) Transcript_132:2675-3310(+)